MRQTAPTAGEITDIVLSFADPDPAVPGMSLRDGGSIVVILPDGFTNTGVGVTQAAILQGWPQSPPAPPPLFPWTATVVDNTITVELTDDYLVGVSGPGPKALHLVLNSFRNPGPGLYDIQVAIQPDPASPDVHEGTGTVHVIPKSRPNVNIVSVFSGGGPPPPFNNPLYQTVAAGDTSLDVGLYLWEGGSSVADGDVRPYLGVEVEMENPGHGRLVHFGRTVGHVWIDAPAGADDFMLSATPSFSGVSAVTGLDVGIMIVSLQTDADVPGDYAIEFRMNNGNSQEFFVTAN